MKAEYPTATSVRLTQEQFEWLKRTAEDREVFVAEFIRNLIDAERLGE